MTLPTGIYQPTTLPEPAAEQGGDPPDDGPTTKAPKARKRKAAPADSAKGRT